MTVWVRNVLLIFLKPALTNISWVLNVLLVAKSFRVLMFCQLGTHLALKSKWWEAMCSSLPPTRVYRLSLNTLSGGCPLVPGREWRGKQAMAAMFVGASFGTCFSVKALCDDCCKVEPCCCCGWNVNCLGECGSLPFFVCLIKGVFDPLARES